MKTVYFDCETHLIKPGMITPRVVCLSYCDEIEAKLLDRVQGLVWLRKQLSDLQVMLVGHNVVYDFGCYAAEDPSLIPLIFRAYDDGRIRCTQIRQQLIDIGKGEHKYRVIDNEFVKTSYQLATLVKYWCHRHLEKEDTYRLRYSELDGIEIQQWPREAIQYAIDDAKATRDVWQAQDKALEIGIPDEEPQNRAAWALHLASAWGFRTDGVAVAKLRKELEEKLQKAYEILQREGLVRANGKRDMAAIAAQVEKVYDGRTKKTTKGKTQTSKEVLKDSNDPILKILEETSTWRTTLSREVPMLEQGVKFPICPRYNVLVENGRTSCRGERIDGKKVGGNIQNLSRDGYARSCFVPRNGFVFASADYDAAELHSLAQVCLDLLGESSMADALRRGDDLHLRLASQTLGISYEEAMSRYQAGDEKVIKARQGGKHCFHPDTEVLTKNGWKKIGNLIEGEEVIQAFPDINGVRLSWVVPLQLIKLKHDSCKLIHLKNEGIDIRVTPDHRMLVYRTDGHYDVVTPEKVSVARGWANAGLLKAQVSCIIDDNLLRLAVAMQADGSYASGSKQLRFGFHKQRKIDRMESLLENFPQTDWVKKEVFRPPLEGKTEPYRVVEYIIKSKTAYRVRNILDGKSFSWSWLGLSVAARRLVLEESEFWDGSKPKNCNMHQFYSTDMQSINVLQAIAAITSLKTRVVNSGRQKEYHNDIYTLTIRDKWDTRGENIVVKELSYDDEVVCLSVPSSFVLVRDGGITLICGQCNFGFGGGMGARRFIETVKPFGMIITEKEAEQLREAWFKTWPEMRKYFAFISNIIGPLREARIEQLRSGRIRGGVGFCDGCNSFFSGMTADGAKAALYAVSKECYTIKSSPLFGSRPVGFYHDEIMIETPDHRERASSAATRLADVMREEMQKFQPDIPVGVSPVLTRRWLKGAKAVFGPDKVLLPSKSVKIESKTVWVVDNLCVDNKVLVAERLF